MATLKDNLPTIWNTILVLALGAIFSLCCWTAKTVITQGNELAKHDTLLVVTSGRVDSLESKGSRNLEAHVKDDDTRVLDLKDRVSKLEAAVLNLASMPGEIKAIGVRLDGIDKTQARIEKTVEEIHARHP